MPAQDRDAVPRFLAVTDGVLSERLKFRVRKLLIGEFELLQPDDIRKLYTAARKRGNIRRV